MVAVKLDSDGHELWKWEVSLVGTLYPLSVEY